MLLLIFNMLFTMTTCLHVPRKVEQTRKCLELLFSVETYWEPVTKYVVINEHPGEAGAEAAAAAAALDEFKEKYPFVSFIQKDKERRGQAHSINMIIDILKNKNGDGEFDHWLHWEESWMLREPFMRDAVDVMLRDPDVTQLQIAKGWDDVPHEVNDGYLLVSKEYHDKIDRALGKVPNTCRWKRKPWPLFSLQPGIDRVDKITNAGYFFPEHNTVPHGKVNGSEFHFSHRWYLQGVRKGVLLPFRAFRDPTHVSTCRFIS